MLSNSKVQTLRAQLQTLAQELNDAIALVENASKPVSLDQTLQGRVSRGDALQQQHMAKAGLERNKKHLVQVLHALERMDDEDYGFCLECGGEINIGRLEIMPEAELCIPCKEKHE